MQDAEHSQFMESEHGEEAAAGEKDISMALLPALSAAPLTPLAPGKSQ